MKNLEEAKTFFKNDIYATETTGISILDVKDNYAKCAFDIERRHLNAANTVMGGAIFTLADFTFAVAANYGKPLTVTLTSQISYLGSPKGTRLISQAHCTKEGRTAVFFLIEIQDDLGNPVASVSVNGYRKPAVE